MFALGFVVGKRAERIAQPEAVASGIAGVDNAQEQHEELTFYQKLRASDSGPRRGRAASAPRIPSKQLPQTPVDTHAFQAKREKRRAAVQKPEAARDKSVQSALRRAAAMEGEAIPSGLSDSLEGPGRSGDYTVQVSAFQSMGEAKAYAAGLERKGYKPYVVTATIRNKGTWYRVRVGRFESEHAAKAAKVALARADIPGWVLKSE